MVAHIKPEVGEYFVDGSGAYCQMKDNDMYDRLEPFKTKNLYYIVGNDQFSRLLRIRDYVDYKNRRAIANELTGENKMNLRDVMTALAHGHDTTKGLAELEAAYIEHIHILSKYNQSRTARNLGMSRGTLRTKLKQYFGSKYL